VYFCLFVVLRVIYYAGLTAGARVYLCQSPYPIEMREIPQDLIRVGDISYVGLIEWWQPIVSFVIANDIYRPLAFVLLSLLTVALIYKVLIENTEHDPHYKGGNERYGSQPIS